MSLDMPSQPTFALMLPARAEYLSVVRHVLVGVVDGWSLDRHDLDDMQIAVTEACAHGVTHAYPGAAAGSMEVLGARNEDGRAVVTVRDRRLGVQRDAENVEAGMGIGLIGALTEDLEFAHADDGTHEVRMVFSRSAP